MTSSDTVKQFLLGDYNFSMETAILCPIFFDRIKCFVTSRFLQRYLYGWHYYSIFCKNISLFVSSFKIKCELSSRFVVLKLQLVYAKKNLSASTLLRGGTSQWQCNCILGRVCKILMLLLLELSNSTVKMLFHNFKIVKIFERNLKF